MMRWMTCLFVFTDDDKREFFRTQRERIHAGRRVDTTGSIRLIQTALRDWPAPHTIPETLSGSFGTATVDYKKTVAQEQLAALRLLANKNPTWCWVTTETGRPPCCIRR